MTYPIRSNFLNVTIAQLLALVLMGSGNVFAQTAPDVFATEEATLFPHPVDTRWLLAGQANLIAQAHDDFASLYEGENSLRSHREAALSSVWTLYTGLRVAKRTELLFDIESAGGRGRGDALGLAGFTNLDVVRNPTLGSKPYVARLMLHQTIALSRETTAVHRGLLSLATEQPTRRVEIRVGKIEKYLLFA